MRIVYDDTMLNDFIKLFNEFFDKFWNRQKGCGKLEIPQMMKPFVKYDWGTDRVQDYEIDNAFRAFLKPYKFEISTKNISTSQIGNNRAYEVRYVGNPKEYQIVCEYHPTHGMYGEAYFSIRDFDGNVIKGGIEIGRYGRRS